MQLRVKFQGQNPLFAKTPERAIYRVADTPPAPSSTTNESKNMAFKRATLDNGGEIQVPEFVKVGDEIIVNLADQKYVSRAPKN